MKNDSLNNTIRDDCLVAHSRSKEVAARRIPYSSIFILSSVVCLCLFTCFDFDLRMMVFLY